MSVTYRAVGWNRQKIRYDLALLIVILLFVSTFVLLTVGTNPNVTAETLIIRSTALSAFFLLSLLLAIGPLSRLDARFLPLLYNRRHLGVTIFFLGLIHGGLSLFQFHGLGDKNPVVSLFTAYQSDYWPADVPDVAHFPFEPFGFFALLILFLMAATSHDFWLKNLGPRLWKAIHLLVLVAYGLLILHVSLGFLQAQTSPLYASLLLGSAILVLGLHVLAAVKENRVDRVLASTREEGYLDVCPLGELEEGWGKTVSLGTQRVAVFLHKGEVYALSNTCRHQGGPLGEGKIIDGCITCPWHGWQYYPRNGQSPPPFNEQVDTYPVRVVEGRILVFPKPRIDSDFAPPQPSQTGGDDETA